MFKLTESKNYEVSDIASSEVRIILLYCTQREAKLILANGAKAGLNTSNYLWIVTQSVVGDPSQKMMGLESLQIGMLGIHFTPNLAAILKDIMPLAVRVRRNDQDLRILNLPACRCLHKVLSASLIILLVS